MPKKLTFNQLMMKVEVEPDFLPSLGSKSNGFLTSKTVYGVHQQCTACSFLYLITVHVYSYKNSCKSTIRKYPGRCPLCAQTQRLRKAQLVYNAVLIRTETARETAILLVNNLAELFNEEI